MLSSEAVPQPETTNTRGGEVRHAEHPDAFAPVANTPPVRDGVRDTPARAGAAVANLELLPARDRRALRLLAQLRLLSYAHLRLAAYDTAHPSVTRRRMTQLAQRGLVSVWESPARAGGHTRYALLTPAATRVMTTELARAVEQEPFAPLVRLMLPQTTRRALTLTPGARVPWLAHQIEINTLLLRMHNAGTLPWMSAWDCPFPSRLASFEMPQPDYIVVEERDGVRQLVFGEHDRGSEPVERFVARKVLLYAALAAFPEACEQHFGFRAFTVRVTVTDPIHRAPVRRLRELLAATRAACGSEIAHLFRFTLAGWLHAYTDAAIWASVGNDLTHDAVRWQEHVLAAT
jgi:hypothetical protein